MREVLSRCGYRCDLCPAYEPNLKTLADRQRISEGWLKYFGFRIAPEEVGCVGCLNQGKHAYENCPVRPCVVQRGLQNCAHCDNFGCEKLQPIMEFAKQLGKQFENMPAEDYVLFVHPYESKARLTQIRQGA